MTWIRINRRALVGALAATALAPARLHAAAATPSDTVRHFYAALLDMTKQAATLNVKGRYQKLAPVVQATFDVPFMTKMSIGSAWGRLSPEQKQRATQAFGRYITATYATQFEGEGYELLGEEKIKHATLVRTQLVQPGGDKLTINYVMHDNTTAWQIRDIYLAGAISELATRRSDFLRTLRSGGVDALIVQLNKKADELLG